MQFIAMIHVNSVKDSAVRKRLSPWYISPTRLAMNSYTISMKARKRPGTPAVACRAARQNTKARIAASENDITSETFVDHIAHAADLVGAEHVGISLDYAFDAANVDVLLDEHKSYWPENEDYGRWPTSFVPPKQLMEITETMVRRGFRDKEILGILGGNFMRVANNVWK